MSASCEQDNEDFWPIIFIEDINGDRVQWINLRTTFSNEHTSTMRAKEDHRKLDAEVKLMLRKMGYTLVRGERQ